MSLLLDAMKKSGLGNQSTGLTLEAHPNQAEQQGSTAENNPTESSRAASNPIESSRSAGQNLFAAKKKAPPRRRWNLGLVPTTLLICSILGAAYGFYLWNELNPPVQRVAARPLPPPPQIQPITPPPLVAAIAPVPPPAQEPAPAAPPAPSPQAVAPMPTTAPVASPKLRSRVTPQTRPPRLAIQSQPQVDTITPALQEAWQAYQRGDFAAASAGYRNVLAQDIRNRDALLGMGAIAQQTGKDQEAQQFYWQVLLLDPRDPVALAAMTLYATPNTEDAEIRLRQMLANQPRSAALHYALGNVYMDQARWAEAQQAYFTALALEPGNPQFSFNLAVSLDHLGQRKLAADYYRQTLQLDPAGQSGFDAAQTQRRLTELTATR